MRASGYERNADDWYVEPASVVDALLDVELFIGRTWDPACGGGNIPMRFITRGLDATGSDIRDRGWGETPVDFLASDNRHSATNIASNPPYGILQEWVDHARAIVPGKVAILARLAFLEGQKRRDWFKNAGLARVWVSSKRVSMPPGGSDIPAKGGSIAYAWFVFDQAHRGAPTLGWL